MGLIKKTLLFFTPTPVCCSVCSSHLRARLLVSWILSINKVVLTGCSSYNQEAVIRRNVDEEEDGKRTLRYDKMTKSWKSKFRKDIISGMPILLNLHETNRCFFWYPGVHRLIMARRCLVDRPNLPFEWNLCFCSIPVEIMNLNDALMNKFFG